MSILPSALRNFCTCRCNAIPKFSVEMSSHHLWQDDLQNCWPTNSDKLYFQPGLLSEIITIKNLRHAASRIWTCIEPEFRLRWMKFAVVFTTTRLYHYTNWKNPWFHDLTSFHLNRESHSLISPQTRMKKVETNTELEIADAHFHTIVNVEKSKNE